MKLLKRILLALLALLVLALLYIFLFVNEGKPTILADRDADAMANKMMTAVNKAAFDTLAYAAWNFAGRNSYVWDKTTNDALVSWDDVEVHLDMDEVTGRALKGGQEISGDEAKKLVDKAWSNWCNDSFWFNAPVKAFDKGTVRNIATDKDGKEGLLISYVSGGVTPGDQYLWYLDDSGQPTGYKMWVDIIPIGGAYASWGDWQALSNGAMISGKHKLMGMVGIDITDIKSGMTWQEMGYDKSPIQF